MAIKIPNKAKSTTETKVAEKEAQEVSHEEQEVETTNTSSEASDAPKVNLEAKQGKAVSTIQKGSGPVKEQIENVGDVIMTAVPMANVGVDMAMTINLGNYNSVKVGVRLSLPTPVEELDQGYETASEWVKEKMEKLVQEAQE